MQLSVSVQDVQGHAKFLRVPTQKSAPLHASLDNLLQKPPYWYDIVGPRFDINWNTPSGMLQGAQLTLRQRAEPNENSMSDIYGTSATRCQPPPSNPLGMNIPPEQHAPITEENGPSLLNNLSNDQMPISQRNPNLSPPPPRLCFPLQPPSGCGVVAQQSWHHNSPLDDFEPMTSFGPPRSEGVQRFPNFDTSMTTSALRDFDLGSAVNMASLQDSTCQMEYHPSSYTDVKHLVVPHTYEEPDETLCKENVKPVHKNMNIVTTDPATPLHENMNIGAVEHDEMAFAEGLQFPETNKSPNMASSFMHPDYITHDSIIHFYNNPSSPQSLGSNSSSISSTGGSDVRPQFFLDQSSTEPGCVETYQYDASQNAFKKRADAGNYVPVTFLEQQSQNLKKTLVSDVSEEDNMQVELSETDNSSPVEGKDIARGCGFQQEAHSYPKLCTAASTSAINTNKMGKPKPCTYTTYRPGDFQPRPIPSSVSLDSEPGYMDMRGSHHPASHPHQTPTTSAMMAGIHSCMSADGYVNQMPDFNHQNASSSHNSGRSLSSPNLESLLLSRNRNPLPAGADMLQPRDRRPLNQDQVLLLDDPEPEYTYIDAVSVSPHADFPRRVSEGALSAAGGNHHAAMPQAHRNLDAGRRNSHPRGSASATELQQVPGWNPHITERTVEREMSRYINDDGNFVVWWYVVGSKYVISVSHLRSIRHYAVYESEREGKVFYYIFPKGVRFNSLSALVLHCQKRGVTEPTKTFKTPDGKQAHRSIGRFSHVHLKFPIPARRN